MGPRLLLLDDDAAFTAEAQTALASAGCDVTSLPTGDSGLARAVTDHFDLVLVSAELRGVNGFRLCNRMKKDPRVQAVPVFLLTSEASWSSVEAHRALPTRADVYLHKPIAMAELLAQVRSHVVERPSEPADDEPTRPHMRVVLKPGSLGPPPLPPVRARTETISGVAPAPRTLPPPRPAKEADGTIRRLAQELSSARREAEATAALRARIAELQENTARLARELGEARAAAAKGEAEAEGLRRQQRAAAPVEPKSAASADVAALRARLQDKDYELLSLRTGLETEQRTAAEAWERARIAEEAAAAHEQAAQGRNEELAQADKRLAVAKAEREAAVRRADDAARKADRLKAEVEQARQHSEQGAAERAADRAVVAELRAALERSGVEAREQAAKAVAGRERAHVEQLSALRAEQEAAAAKLGRELKEARATAESAAAAARADAEHTARAELEAARRDFERRLAAARTPNDDLVEEAQRAAQSMLEERDWLVHELDEAQSTIAGLKESVAAVTARLEAEVEARDAVHDEELRRLRAQYEGRREVDARDEVDVRVAEVRSAHAVALASLQEARDGDIVRLRAEHGREVDRLLRELTEERARSEEWRRAQAPPAPRTESTEALERVRREAAEQVARAHAECESAVALAEQRARDAVRDAEQERDRRVLVATQAAAEAEERRAREAADAKAASEAALARLDHEQVKMELHRDAAIADATLDLRVALAKAVKERDEAAAAARAAARAEAEAERRQEGAERMDEATAELRIELEGARAAAVAELRRAHVAEVQRLGQQAAQERAEARGRIDAIERALVSARDALAGERRARIEERTAAAARIDALEQLGATRADELESLRRHSTELHSELPALEAEIVVLRTDLTEMRRKLDEQTALAREAEQQLDRQRVLLARTRDSLAVVLGREALDPSEGGEEPT